MDRPEWNRRYGGTELLWTAEPNPFLVREVSDLAPGRALDLAPEAGRNAVWLARRGWTVTAVDFSAAKLDKVPLLAAEAGERTAVDGLVRAVRDQSPALPDARR